MAQTSPRRQELLIQKAPFITNSKLCASAIKTNPASLAPVRPKAPTQQELFLIRFENLRWKSPSNASNAITDRFTMISMILFCRKMRMKCKSAEECCRVLQNFTKEVLFWGILHCETIQFNPLHCTFYPTTSIWHCIYLTELLECRQCDTIVLASKEVSF